MCEHQKYNSTNKSMSNTRQFLVSLNYDITKPVYPTEEVVRKRKYNINEIKSIKQYYQLHANIFAGETNFQENVYADKLRRRAKFR
jgi:hypothetical protein